MTRQAALDELSKPPFEPDEARQDRLFVAKKLGVSEAEFDAILAGPRKTYLDYPSNAERIEKLLRIKSIVGGWLRSKKAPAV